MFSKIKGKRRCKKANIGRSMEKSSREWFFKSRRTEALGNTKNL
jgi:hypothetical protein